MNPSRTRSGFTLIELLTVISIIAILMGLLLPALNAAKNQAKKTQAKNDLTQLTGAVKNFYADYGVYPVDPTFVQSSPTTDAAYGFSGASPGGISNSDVVNVLRADTATGDSMSSGTSTFLSINPRQQVYLDVPYVKDLTNPKGGLGNGTESSNYKHSSVGGTWYDPWGVPYMVAIDSNYDGYTEVPSQLDYTNANDISYSKDPNNKDAVQTGCVGGSYGADHQKGSAGNGTFIGSDDVLSWQ